MCDGKYIDQTKAYLKDAIKEHLNPIKRFFFFGNKHLRYDLYYYFFNFLNCTFIRIYSIL